MEIPGCLVALALATRLRRQGMDAAGNSPGEPGFAGAVKAAVASVRETAEHAVRPLRHVARLASREENSEELMAVGADTEAPVHRNGHIPRGGIGKHRASLAKFGPNHQAGSFDGDYPSGQDDDEQVDVDLVKVDPGAPVDISLMEPNQAPQGTEKGRDKPTLGKLFHEVFLNPGSFLLFVGLAIGFISRLQGQQVVANNDALFVSLFQGMLCLFLLEMGMTASNRLKDLKHAGWRFAAFALIAPNVFAGLGICVAHLYSLWLGQPFDVGTYALFAVLCGSASYIAVPALQRMAIPEASPTLPLAASLGLTFSYNVTLGIPLYLLAATALTTYFPVAA